MLNQETVTATPNPGPAAVTSATGLMAAVGWGATVLGAKYGIPPEVVGGILTGAATLLGAVWSRFFGPGVQVPKSQ